MCHVTDFLGFFFLSCSADLDTPVLTVHQTISDVRGSYYQEKTVFLRCTVNSNPPARFIWKRGSMLIEQSKDNGVDIYEPLYTQVHHALNAAESCKHVWNSVWQSTSHRIECSESLSNSCPLAWTLYGTEQQVNQTDTLSRFRCVLFLLKSLI